MTTGICAREGENTLPAGARCGTRNKRRWPDMSALAGTSYKFRNWREKSRVRQKAVYLPAHPSMVNMMPPALFGIRQRREIVKRKPSTILAMPGRPITITNPNTTLDQTLTRDKYLVKQHWSPCWHERPAHWLSRLRGNCFRNPAETLPDISHSSDPCTRTTSPHLLRSSRYRAMRISINLLQVTEK